MRESASTVSAQTFETFLRSVHPGVPIAGAAAALKLAGEGATVPFIARYRKEQTGNLDEVALRAVIDAKERWDGILARQSFILEQIERQSPPVAAARLMYVVPGAAAPPAPSPPKHGPRIGGSGGGGVKSTVASEQMAWSL